MPAVGPGGDCAPLMDPFPSHCSWTCPSCSPSPSSSSSPQTMSPGCWERCCGTGWAVGGPCHYLVLALCLGRDCPGGLSLGWCSTMPRPAGAKMHFQGRSGSDPALPQGWSPFLASQVVAGMTVASAKSFRTFSRNYPDHLVLIMALASPQTSVGVCSHHQQQWDPVDILLTCGTLGLLP